MARVDSKLLLFIVESPNPIDVFKHRTEGKVLASVSELVGHRADYMLVKTEDELRAAARYIASIDTSADADKQDSEKPIKELGFPLEEIRHLLDDPEFNVREALVLQRELLTERQVRLQTLLQSVEKALEAHEKGIAMSKEEMFEVFGDFDPAEHEAEVQQRWGDTDAFKESRKRTARYTKQDWITIRNEAESIYRRLVDHMEAGQSPSEPKVMDLAEEHRKHIDRWFYPCSKVMHRGLGDLYVNDPRFTANIEKAGVGLAAYLREAIIANAGRP